MHKHVFAILAADKAVTFGVVEPLHCSWSIEVYWRSFSEFTLEGVGRDLRRLLAVRQELLWTDSV
jgi:hypothetical protein